MKVFTCTDCMGEDCTWIARAPTVELLVTKIVGHFHRAHDFPSPLSADDMVRIHAGISDD